MATQECPCGFLGDGSSRCRCTQEQIRRYRSKISGPLLDRIDMYIEVPNVPREILLDPTLASDSSALVRARVCMAREHQIARSGKPNSHLSNREIERYCKLNQADTNLLSAAIDRLGLSARSVHRILKVARTIADLSDSEVIQTPHLSEAISYRRLERIRC